MLGEGGERSCVRAWAGGRGEGRGGGVSEEGRGAYVSEYRGGEGAILAAFQKIGYIIWCVSQRTVSFVLSLSLLPGTKRKKKKNEIKRL